MSLKRRNIFAWLLLLVAAVAWSFGWLLLGGIPTAGTPTATTGGPTIPVPVEPANTTFPTRSTVESTVVRATDPTQATPPVTAPTDFTGGTAPVTMSAPTIDSSAYQKSSAQWQPSSVERVPEVRERDDLPPSSKPLGLALCLIGGLCGFVSVFVFRQKTPLLGPDGILLLAGLGQWLYQIWRAGETTAQPYTRIVAAYLILILAGLMALRELWGWLRNRFSLSWCLIRRLGAGFQQPQITLFTYTFWILACIGAGVLLQPQLGLWTACFGAAALIAGICLWRYGADLGHLKGQLANYHNGLPIQVKNGSFAQTEQQLLDARDQQQQAIQKALTSERFKVELISNVSHDLRTPLTSILGYSELLQKEELSPEGKEQLRCLYQKAGYMNELVDALFELTKVSSGVVEAKREEIDLVRLLEQTVGLFDDQLTVAGLTVRRSYPADSLPVITDGSRLHQVFANLLGNAIKYALAGTRIFLEVRQLPDSLFVRMVNTASYEMDFQADQIVQRFARGDKSRSTKGSGLGLAIAQTYTESVGGSFRVCVDGDQFSAIVTLPITERDL